MQKGNIKVRRSLNRCAQKENVADLNLNNLNRERTNLSIPSLTMRPSKLLPHLEANHEVKKMVQKRSRQDDGKSQLRKASVTMVTNPSKIQSFKHITLSPIALEPNEYENMQLVRTYGQEYMELAIKNCRPPTQFLKAHSISASLRARMLDWMIEVIASFRFTDSTLFLAVHLMDRFFAESEQKHEAKDLHALGVVSIFIASKLNEIYPLRMKTLFEKIVHRKVPVEQLRDRQAEYLRAFGYRCDHSTVYETAKIVLALLRTDHLVNKKLLDEIEQSTVFVLKMAMFEYSILTEYSQLEIVAAAVALVAKLHQQHQEHSLEAESLREHITTMLKLERPQHLADCSLKLQRLAKGFDRHYPGLTNLKKFNKQDLGLASSQYDTL